VSITVIYDIKKHIDIEAYLCIIIFKFINKRIILIRYTFSVKSKMYNNVIIQTTDETVIDNKAIK